MKQFKLDMTGHTHRNVNYGDSIVRYMAKDSVNKIDSRLLSGVDDNATIKDLIERSDYITERSRFGNTLSMEGSYFVCLLKFDEWIIKNFQIVSYTKDMFELTEVIVNSEPRYDKGSYTDVYIRFYINEDGKVVRDMVVQNLLPKKGEGNYKRKQGTKEYIYPDNVTKIPGNIIRNNSFSLPDYIEVEDILKEINKLSNMVGVEIEFAKIQMNNNAIYGDGTTAEEEEEYIEGGRRVRNNFSDNGEGATQLEVAMAGAQSPEMITTQIIWLEDRAFKFSHNGRDMDGSGTNKHNTQVSLFGQSAAEYINLKKEQRERDLYKFFVETVSTLVPGAEVTAVKFALTDYEQGKVETFELNKSQIELNYATVNQQLAKAEENKASAKQKEEQAKLTARTPAPINQPAGGEKKPNDKK